MPKFWAPTPSCGRPPPHRKTSGPKRFGFVLFVLPENGRHARDYPLPKNCVSQEGASMLLRTEGRVLKKRGTVLKKRRVLNLVARVIRNAIRATQITRISDSRESPDSRESCESNRANHATKVLKKVCLVRGRGGGPLLQRKGGCGFLRGGGAFLRALWRSFRSSTPSHPSSLCLPETYAKLILKSSMS